MKLNKARHKKMSFLPEKKAEFTGLRHYASAPNWYQATMGRDLKDALDTGRPTYLFIGMRSQHGDDVFERIRDPRYQLAEFDFVKGGQTDELGRAITRFCAYHPDVFRRMIVSRLVPLKDRIKGVIFDLRWPTLIHVIASVCDELKIAKILIPDEPVFKQKYDRAAKSYSSAQIADLILGYGDMQRQEFIENGCPADRFIAAGPTIFDSYNNVRPQLTRDTLCRLYRLAPERKIILFAAEPLATNSERKSQRDAINDLFDYSLANNMQLIVRTSSNGNIIDTKLHSKLISSYHTAIDDALSHLVEPTELLFHSDIVTSFNNDVLFEGLLMGKPALSVRYTGFNQIWENIEIPTVTNSEELDVILNHMTTEGWTPSIAGMKWAARMFGPGEFDGNARKRISDILANFSSTGSFAT